MGKAVRKMEKKQQKDKKQAVKRDTVELKKKLDQQMEQEKYDEALGTIAELAKMQGAVAAEADTMYEAAYCYFMTGDYKRTAVWIDNTLSRDPGHKRARILLARLCILENRTDDGLAVFDFILDKWQNGLTDDETDEVEEILEYYGRSEADKLRRDYPHIATFLSLPPAAETAAPAAAPLSSAVDTLAALKQRTQAAADGVQATAAELAQKAREQVPVVQEKLDDVKEQVQQAATDARQKAQNTAAGVQSTLAAMKQKLAAISDAARKPVPPATAVAEGTASDALAAAKAKRDEVLAKDASNMEKLRMLNAFAGAHYYEGEYAVAEVFLQAALQLDAYQEDTLRNMARLRKAQGRLEEAMACAAKLPMMDFALLDALRQQ